jgi:succinyl-CoA synthetase beta subunit
MDAIRHLGGRAANFTEIGGDAYTKATPALELVLSNPRVKSLLVNFCGAFARTDVMTEGVVNAIEELRPTLPISFSIHGTGEEEAVALLRQRLGYEPYERMEDAVQAAVDAAAAAGATTEASR